MGSVATKRVYVPVAGHFLTDGKQLVEVTGKHRSGFVVLDATAELIDPDVGSAWAPIVLTIAEFRSGGWRRVLPLPEVVDGA